MPTAFTPPAEPGFRFSDGKLRIFQGDAVMVIGAWPQLEAVRKSPESPRWEPFFPAFRLVKPYRPSKEASGSRAGRTRTKSSTAEPAQLDFGFLDSFIEQP